MNVDDFLLNLRRMLEQLRAENNELKAQTLRLPQLEKENADLKARLDLARKTKQTLQTIEGLEETIRQREATISVHEETIGRLSHVETENATVRGQHAALVESQGMLHAELKRASSEEKRLRVIVDDDEKVRKLREFEDWLYAIAERMGVKANSTIEGTRLAVADAVRKLLSR